MIRHNGLPRATGFLILALDRMCREGRCDAYVTCSMHRRARLSALVGELHGGAFLAEAPFMFTATERIPQGDRAGLRAALYQVAAGAQS